MKIKYRLAAVASAVALTGAACLASAGAASANTQYLWCVTQTVDCIVSHGSGHAVGIEIPIYATNFASKNGEITNGHEYVEYYQIGTNACLTDSGANVYLQTCSAGDTRELWWFDASHSHVVNDYATVHYGHNDCMTENLNVMPITVVV
jgi:hypothetical protein